MSRRDPISAFFVALQVLIGILIVVAFGVNISEKRSIHDKAYQFGRLQLEQDLVREGILSHAEVPPNMRGRNLSRGAADGMLSIRSVLALLLAALLQLVVVVTTVGILWTNRKKL